VVMRTELASLLTELNQQMGILITSNIQANERSAQKISESNERMAANEDWRQRSRARLK